MELMHSISFNESNFQFQKNTLDRYTWASAHSPVSPARSLMCAGRLAHGHMQRKMKGENTGMGMIECINYKKREQRDELVSEMSNSIDRIDELISMLGNAGASREITNALMTAREQIHFERRKIVAEMNKGVNNK